MKRNILALITFYLVLYSVANVNAQIEKKSMFIPEIILVGNGEEIPDGDSVPSTKNNTHFGNVGITHSQTEEFFIDNSGPATLVISDINFTGENAVEYSLTEIPSYPINIETGKSFSFQVSFTPKKGGTRSCSLNIINNDLDEGVYNVRLEAEATFTTVVDCYGAPLIGLTVYPNPAKDVATILFPSDEQAVAVHIFNLQGQEVQAALTTTIWKESQQVEIVTSAIENGIYYVTLNSITKQQTAKIVVAH